MLTVRSDTSHCKNRAKRGKIVEQFKIKKFEELTKQEQSDEMEGWLKDHDMTWQDIENYHQQEQKNVPSKNV